MLTTKVIENRLGRTFSPIGLDEMNERASLMRRLDNKYLVTIETLLSVLQQAAGKFDVMTIGSHNTFPYSTTYYDDSDHRCFYDHHNKRRNRVKVRERLYEQSGHHFIEVKLKGKRGETVKRRMATPNNKGIVLPEKSLEFVGKVYSEHYGRDLSLSFSQSLFMRYFRVTLVGKEVGERVTIDCQLHYLSRLKTVSVHEGQLIVEVKSENGFGVFDRLLRRHGVRPVKRLSKYCLGLCLTGRVERYNNFLRPLRRLNCEIKEHSCIPNPPNSGQPSSLFHSRCEIFSNPIVLYSKC